MMCAKLIHHSGISKVVIVDGGFMGENGIEYLASHGVEIQSAEGPKDPRSQN
jgi:dCMP deaminase